MKNDSFTLSGRSTLRAWAPGVIQKWIDRGYPIKSAIKRAIREGALFYENTVHNLVVTSGKELVADLILDVVNTGLVYHAIGTGITTPSSSDTSLTTEVARKTWASKTRSGATISFSQFYLAAESTFNIKECGVFGGDSASATLDSGELFSHYLQSYDNSAGLVDLTFEYELEVE